MTQINLPPYHRPRSPLDLVAIKIILGCIFEVAIIADTAVDDNDRPMKRSRQPSLRKVLVPR
jgi:hypothetical protein